MVFVEGLEASLEVGELVAEYQSHTGADALLVAARNVEGDGADTVADEFVEQIDAIESGIAEGEVEAVTDVLAHILVVDDIEAVVGEHLLHDTGLLAIFLDILDEVEGAVVGALKHSGHSILHAVGGAGGEAVEGTENEGTT